MDQVSLFPDFKEFLKLLNSANVRYLLVGGYAVNYFGYHRNTVDIDIWIAVEPTNAVRVSEVFQKFGFEASDVPPALFLEKGKIIRCGRTPVLIEILTNPTGVEFEECYAKRVVGQLDGIDVSIISLSD